MEKRNMRRSSYDFLTTPTRSNTSSGGNSYNKNRKFGDKDKRNNTDGRGKSQSNGKFSGNSNFKSDFRNKGESFGNRDGRFGRNQGNRRFGSNAGSRGNFSRNRRSRGGNRARGNMTAMSYDKYIMKAEEVEVKLYEPKHKFEDFKLENILKENIAKRNYVYPTPIQDQAIPEVLEGRDLLGLAATGSGKTAAFLIPMINKVLKDRFQKVLIIVPTRELASQIQEEFIKFSVGTRLRSVITIGGASIGKQIYLLQKNPQFVIATPGRIKDLHQRRAINLSQFNNIVLDEVDRMLDMGFVDEIKFLISKLREEKQSIFFSATMSKESENVANSLLNNPVRVEIESQKASKTIDQDIVKVSPDKKIDTLHDLLIQEEFYKVLIFSKTKRGADKLTYELVERGFKVDSLHGDKSQFVRDRVITKFRTNSIKILVATDVAARGIDIPDISHVINFDEPATYEDYIHRIGRTGRVGKKGKALTFVS